MILYRKLLKSLIIAAALGAGAAAGGAQTAPVRQVTLADAIGIALKQNGTILQAKNAQQASAATVTQQRLQFLPDLRLSTSSAQSVGQNFSQTDGRIINQTTQSLNAGLSSSVVLFDGMRNLAALRGAQASEEASSRDLARTEQTVVFTVASNFLALVTQQEQLRVQQENLTALEAQEKQIKTLVDAGARPISDLYQVQASVANARAAVVDAQRARELANVDLIQTLRLDARDTYDFVPPTVNEAAAAAKNYSLDSLVTRALATRVDVRAQSARADAAKQDVKAAQGSRWPTVSLTGGYSTAYSSANTLAFADQLGQRRGGSVGVGVSIPLFDKGSTAVAVQRARIAEDNANLALDTERQTVALEVRRAYLDFTAAKERLVASDAQQKAAALAVKAALDRYQVGASTLLEVTQARAGLVQAESALVSARYNLVFQQSLMQYYTGELDPHGGMMLSVER